MKTNGCAKVIALAVVAIMTVSVLPVALTDHSEAASGFTVKDGRGTEVSFEKVPDHVVTIGLGLTATVLLLDGLNKISVTDKYPRTETDPIFDELKKNINEDKVKSAGSIYGIADLKTAIIDAADTGMLDRTNDPILIAGVSSSIEPFISELSSLNFKKILWWNSMEEYGDLMDYVSTISTVLTGEETDKVKQMKHVSEVIDDGVKDKTVKTEAFYVTYSGGTYKVGNIGSLANSMIIAAGGHSITTSDTDAKPTYGRNITDLVDAHPNAVIFIDASIVKDHKDDFYSKLGDAHNKVVELKPLWNNYCIESMNGVWTMACAMYPDAFSGDVPEVEKDKNDNTMLYVAIGGAAAAAVIVVGLLFLRKH